MTTEPIGDLNVVSIYQDLMKASTGQGSAYIRAKETMVSLLQDNSMTAAEKAAVISKTIGDISTSITSQALGAAIQIAKENRDAPYALAKLRADTELTQAQTTKTGKDSDMLTANIAKVTADKNTTIIQGWKVQADIYSKNGIDVSGVPATTTVLGISGLPKNTLASDHVGGEQAKASTYSTLAGASRKDGNVTISRDPITNNITGLYPTTPLNECLTGAQINVAIRQEKAFDDNKVQHAANSSSSMIGMLLSTENSSALDVNDIGLWRSAVTELNTPTSTSITSKTITITSIHTTTSKSGDVVISGTSTGLTFGTNLVVYLRNVADNSTSDMVVDIITSDGNSWSATLTVAQMNSVNTTANEPDPDTQVVDPLNGEITVSLGAKYSSVSDTVLTTITA